MSSWWTYFKTVKSNQHFISHYITTLKSIDQWYDPHYITSNLCVYVCLFHYHIVKWQKIDVGANTRHLSSGQVQQTVTRTSRRRPKKRRSDIFATRSGIILYHNAFWMYVMPKSLTWLVLLYFVVCSFVTNKQQNTQPQLFLEMLDGLQKKYAKKKYPSYVLCLLFRDFWGSTNN